MAISLTSHCHFERSQEPMIPTLPAVLRFTQDDKLILSLNKPRGGRVARLHMIKFLDRRGKPRLHTSTITYAAWLVLLGCLPSSVALPRFTLICFGFASAFLGRLIFSTPLS